MIHAGNLAMEMYEFFGDWVISRNFFPLDIRIYDPRFSAFEVLERKVYKSDLHTL
jgi:hypothetical protein